MQRYFPGGDVLQAVTKPGIIWRVGNRSRIRIWKDPWIPKEWTRLPSRPRGTNLLQTVDELIDPELGSWDEQLLRQTFCLEDAEINYPGNPGTY